jgi:hypothetical protein
MRVITLPHLEEFTSFTTLGPSGSAKEDVNGRAVAIECFLDLTFGPKTIPAIRWTSFDQERGVYQGELVRKEEYTKRFFENINESAYDFTKLTLLWKHILQACASEVNST